MLPLRTPEQSPFLAPPGVRWLRDFFGLRLEHSDLCVFTYVSKLLVPFFNKDTCQEIGSAQSIKDGLI